MTRVVCGIQARTSSTRLPGKVLADLAGKPLIERVVERVRRCVLVDEVYVLTSDDPSDDELADVCLGLGVPVRRGSLEDVLSRYLALANEREPDHLVRVTGDCPLLEPDHVDLQLGALVGLDADFAYVADDDASGGFDGTLAGAGAFSVRALSRAAASRDPRDREHVASFFFKRQAQAFRHVELEVDEGYRRPGLRLCVDEPADLELVRAVFDHFGDAPFTTLEAIRWLDTRPALRALQAHVVESADNRACRALARRSRPRPVGRWSA